VSDSFFQNTTIDANSILTEIIRDAMRRLLAWRHVWSIDRVRRRILAIVFFEESVHSEGIINRSSDDHAQIMFGLPPSGTLKAWFDLRPMESQRPKSHVRACIFRSAVLPNPADGGEDVSGILRAHGSIGSDALGVSR